MENEVHLLIAEDDNEDWMLIEESLETCSGVRWERVRNGQELLDRLQEKIPHMILLDLRMPRRDGFWALREIRSDPKLRHIPVTILTTSEDEKDIVRSYTEGANAYLTKPPSFDEMHRLISKNYEFWMKTARIPQA
jgi:two-component system, response regulator